MMIDGYCIVEHDTFSHIHKGDTRTFEIHRVREMDKHFTETVVIACLGYHVFSISYIP